MLSRGPLPGIAAAPKGIAAHLLYGPCSNTPNNRSIHPNIGNPGYKAKRQTSLSIWDFQTIKQY